MILYILTQSDGSPIADKSAASVASVTDTTQTEAGSVVLGDSEPITLKFTTGTAAPAFAGDGTYTPAVLLGGVTPDASQNYANAGTMSTTTGGWTGRMALTGSALQGAIRVLGGGIEAQCPGMAGPRGGWLTLQVRVTNPSGYTYTYALLPVFVEWRV